MTVALVSGATYYERSTGQLSQNRLGLDLHGCRCFCPDYRAGRIHLILGHSYWEPRCPECRSSSGVGSENRRLCSRLSAASLLPVYGRKLACFDLNYGYFVH